jgi:hypothetical protein
LLGQTPDRRDRLGTATGDRRSELQLEIQARLGYLQVAAEDRNYRAAGDQALAIAGAARQLARMYREGQV